MEERRRRMIAAVSVAVMAVLGGGLAAPASTAGAATPSATAESCQPAGADHLAYSTNLDTNYNSVSVIDTNTNKVVRSIKGFHVPANVTPTSDGSKLYVDNWQTPNPDGYTNTQVVNPCTGAIVKTLPSPGGLFPLTNLSPDGRWLYLGAIQGFNIFRIDTRTDKIVQTYSTLKIGAGEPIGYAVPDPDGKHLWVAGLLHVYEFDLATGALVGAPIQVGVSPEWLAVTPNGKRLIATNFAEGTDSIIDTSTRSVIATQNIGLTSYPNSASATPDSSQFWVGNLDGTVSIIDANTGALVKSLSPGKMMSLDVTFNKDGSEAYVDTVPKSSPAVNLNGAATAFGLMVTGVFHAGPGEISVYDTKTYQHKFSFETGGLPSPVNTPAEPF